MCTKHSTKPEVFILLVAASVVVKKPGPNFKVGMKLEAVDRRFPYFVCVATVMDKHGEDQKLYYTKYMHVNLAAEPYLLLWGAGGPWPHRNLGRPGRGHQK